MLWDSRGTCQTQEETSMLRRLALVVASLPLAIYLVLG